MAKRKRSGIDYYMGQMNVKEMNWMDDEMGNEMKLYLSAEQAMTLPREEYQYCKQIQHTHHAWTHYCNRQIYIYDHTGVNGKRERERGTDDRMTSWA
jgi:hypothetical protein